MITVLINPTKFSLAAEATVRKESSIVSSTVIISTKITSNVNAFTKACKRIIRYIVKSFTPVLFNDYTTLKQIVSHLHYCSNLK